MSQIVTWEYYSSLYSQVSENAFNSLVRRAEMKLDAITHMRARKFEVEYKEDTATDFQKLVHSQIQNTVCELINAIAVQDETGMGTGIASVSNDGYSESYKITTAAEKEVQLHGIVRSGLSGTGLAGAL